MLNTDIMIVLFTEYETCFPLQYSGSIKENTQGVEVMRIKAEDLDVKNTENWDAVFDIVKGNEAGYFSITTDPLTNEGILMLDKVGHVGPTVEFNYAFNVWFYYTTRKISSANMGF